MPRVTRSSGARPEGFEVAPPSSTAPIPSTNGRPSRGRPSRASNAMSSASTSRMSCSESLSGSEYATPLTSTVPTPAPATSSEAPSIKANRVEVRIPAKPPAAKPPADSHRSLRSSIYAMSSKRKRDEIDDSENDDLSDPGNSGDLRYARKLQQEENRRAPSSKVICSPSVSRLRGGRATRSSRSLSFLGADNLTEGGPSYGVIHTSKVSGKAIVPDSEDWNDASSPLSPIEAGSDNLPVESDEDIPLKQYTQQKSKPSASTQAQQANDPAPQNENDEDNELGMLSDSTNFSVSPVLSSGSEVDEDSDQNDSDCNRVGRAVRLAMRMRRGRHVRASKKRIRKDRDRLEKNHPELSTMWTDLESMPVLKAGKADQPKSISRHLKPFQLEGIAWMSAMEKMQWRGGLLGDEMGLGKTIQAVSLIMSDFPQKEPSLVLVPPVALMQWMSEINSYTDGTLKTLVYHGTNAKSKGLTVAQLKKLDVIIMSYNSLESMYRKQEKGFKRKEGLYKEKSLIHQIHFHRVILDEAHSIKTRTTMTAKACFSLKAKYRWCLSGTPLQNRIGEFFSLVRFLNVQPFSSYLCKSCPCSTLEWSMDDDNHCTQCQHHGMQHVSVFNQELLNPIQKYGNFGPGAEALRKLRILTDRIMLRRLKKDHTNAMELPVKEIYVDRQFFGEAENDFANSIMTNSRREFDTYVSSGVLLNNYANIFGLIMQMRQVADHPDLLLKKSGEGGQNVLVCCICDEPAEDAIRSKCSHDFCRECVKSYLTSMDGSQALMAVSGGAAGSSKKSSTAFSDDPRCPSCHGPLSIDLEQPEIEQEETFVKKSSIINRIKMENWTSSSKIELLVHELHKLRSDNASHKSIIFSQFTTMLQLIEWRLRRAGITSVMLDGSMTPAQRQASIDHFMNNVDVECFLVSLKAGGVALNLTEASQVFIVDPWWNPAAEWQSADRCHRIGQTRPCTITRLCIEDSVESRMVLLQEKKTNMINSTINSDDKAIDSLSPEDLQFLFRGN